MIGDFQFGTRVLQPVVGPDPESAVKIAALDATAEIPLTSGLWLEGNGTSVGALSEHGPVRRVREVRTSGRGNLYRLRYGTAFDGVDVYRAAVEHGGLFVSGRADGSAWTLRMRFPEREAVDAFRADCAERGAEVSVETLREEATGERYGLTEAQRRALVSAVERGYFEVPRETSLAGLAGDLGVSSQAASERIRRGLDSLVERTLLEPETPGS